MRPDAFGDVFEDDGACLDEAAGGDGAMLLIVGCGVCGTGIDSSACWRLSAFLRAIGLRAGLCEGKSGRSKERAEYCAAEPVHSRSLFEVPTRSGELSGREQVYHAMPSGGSTG